MRYSNRSETGLGVPGAAVRLNEVPAALGPVVAGGLPPTGPHRCVVAEDGDGDGAERDDPVAGVAFHWPGDGRVADGGDLLDDGGVAGVEVDVVLA
jgi:hypothetical protein